MNKHPGAAPARRGLLHAVTLLSLLLLPVTGMSAEAERYTARDIRAGISVTTKERNQVLYEMRELLHGLFNLHSALAKNDFKAVSIAARPLGQLLHKMPESLRERLPEDYVQLGIAMRESFEILARDAEAKKDIFHTQAQLAESMTYCSGCHDTFRFDVRARVPAKK